MSLGNEGVPFTMPVTPAGSSYNGGGWGMDGAWWIIVLFLFAWGNGGWGNGFGGGMNGGVGSEVQRGFDTSAIIGKLDGINNGLCDGFYAVNTSMLNGFNAVGQGLCNLGYQTQSGFHSLSAQMAQCCCDTQRAIDGVNYNLATQACSIQNAIQTSTRDIVDNQNANSRAILDALNQNYIRGLESENQSLKLAASQSNQNAVLMAAMDANKAEILRRTGAECPTPAYVVQPPTPVNFPVNNCGQWASACGCAA